VGRRRNVDNAEAAMGQPDVAININTAVIRPTMGQGPLHGRQPLFLDELMVKRDYACYTAHFFIDLRQSSHLPPFK
jgi:hypothetical protein